MASQPDLIDKTIKFLGKREGIDKARKKLLQPQGDTLKLIRYSSRLVAALSKEHHPDIHKRFAALDSSIGVTRKAFRLGKFLQDVNSLRSSRSTGPIYLLEALAYGGEGIYFFIEQAVWLIKAGAIDKAQERQLVLLSAWAELVGYVGNLVLSFIKLQELNAKERTMRAAMEKKCKENGVLDIELDKKLAAVRAMRALRIAFIVQDVADAAIAINDIRGGTNPFLNHPITLSVAGLLSGSVSAYKNWTA